MRRHSDAGRARRPTRPATLLLGVVLVVAGMLVTGTDGPQAQASAGTFTPEQAVGTDVTTVTAVTNGTCNVPGNPDTPVDGYNAVVVGPGAFAPNAVEGSPEGPAIVSTDNAGLSTTEPIRFQFRATFRELAQERNAMLLPGDYVVTFRCVNQLYGTVFQSFSATFTFTGGPPATAFAVTNPPLAEPVPGPSPTGQPSPEPSASTADAGGPNVSLILLATVIVAAAIATAAYLLARRRSPSRR